MILTRNGFSQTRLPENEISILTFADLPNVGKAKKTTHVLFLFLHSHPLETVIDARAWIRSVKAADGWNRIESAPVLLFLTMGAHRIRFVYLLGIRLEGTVKANDLERVYRYPSSTVDVFEAESG